MIGKIEGSVRILRRGMNLFVQVVVRTKYLKYCRDAFKIIKYVGFADYN